MVKLPKLPEGNLGVAVKLAIGAVLAFIWTAGPGAEEARYVAGNAGQCAPHCQAAPGPRGDQTALQSLARRLPALPAPSDGGRTAQQRRCAAPVRSPVRCRRLRTDAAIAPHASAARPPAQCLLPAHPPPSCRSDIKAKVEKRNQYSRHYALKGRGRKEQLRTDNEFDRSELVPTKAS
jgi:hypothetical protein